MRAMKHRIRTRYGDEESRSLKHYPNKSDIKGSLLNSIRSIKVTCPTAFGVERFNPRSSKLILLSSASPSGMGTTASAWHFNSSGAYTQSTLLDPGWISWVCAMRADISLQRGFVPISNPSWKPQEHKSLLQSADLAGHCFSSCLASGKGRKLSANFSACLPNKDWFKCQNQGESFSTACPDLVHAISIMNCFLCIPGDKGMHGEKDVSCR